MYIILIIRITIIIIIIIIITRISPVVFFPCGHKAAGMQLIALQVLSVLYSVIVVGVLDFSMGTLYSV